MNEVYFAQWQAQKVRSDLLTINGVNVELMLLDSLTRLVTEVFET